MSIVNKMKEFQELMLTISQLDNHDFIKEQGLSAEDIVEIKKNFEKEKENYRADFKDYAIYKIQQRQERQILLDGTKAEMTRLSKLAGGYEMDIKNSDKRLETLMNTFGMEDLETPVGKLKFTPSKRLWVSDELSHELPEDLLEKLPLYLLKFNISDEITSKLASKLKEDGLNVETGLGSKTEITAWLKTLDENTTKEMAKYVEIREHKTFKIK